MSPPPPRARRARPALDPPPPPPRELTRATLSSRPLDSPRPRTARAQLCKAWARPGTTKDERGALLSEPDCERLNQKLDRTLALLLAKNADATAKGQRGKRPVEIANAFGAEPLVAALVAAGAKAPASVAATDEKPQAKGKGAKKGTKK